MKISEKQLRMHVRKALLKEFRSAEGSYRSGLERFTRCKIDLPNQAILKFTKTQKGAKNVRKIIVAAEEVAGTLLGLAGFPGSICAVFNQILPGFGDNPSSYGSSSGSETTGKVKYLVDVDKAYKKDTNLKLTFIQNYKGASGKEDKINAIKSDIEEYNNRMDFLDSLSGADGSESLEQAVENTLGVNGLKVEKLKKKVLKSIKKDKGLDEDVAKNKLYLEAQKVLKGNAYLFIQDTKNNERDPDVKSKFDQFLRRIKNS